MRRFLAFALVLAIGSAVVAPAFAASPSKSTAADPKSWNEAAGALTKITGIAISPLLGTGAVGAWDYWHTSAAQRDQLPWYAHPYFWLPALLLVGVVAAKDAFGTALPPGLKKPLDVAETIENKVSGLVAAGAVVPLMASIFPMTTTSHAMGGPQVCLAGLATFNVAWLFNILTVPLAVVAYGLVWLVAHAINVLILLSPWGVLDAALKSFRTFLLSLVTMTHFVNPAAGAVLSLIVIVIAYFLAGWSFRMMVFGSIYVWDFLSFRRKRFRPAPDANWMFTARKIAKVPIRTYGVLRRSEGTRLAFEFRPWLVGKKQTLALPEGKYAVGVGLFYPEIMLLEGQGEEEKRRTMLVLPPRYRTHEREVAQAAGLTDLRDVGLLKGLKAAWRWLKSLLGFGVKPAPAPAAA